MRALLFLTAFASLASAQLESYTVTVTASRPIAIAADQVSLAIAVTARQGVDVLTPLQSLGITLANLTSMYSSASLSPNAGTLGSVGQLTWNFTWSVPLAGINGTLSQLASLQRTLPLSMSLSYFIASTQPSPQALAAEVCPLAQLVADARTEAQSIAGAAGFGLGIVSAMSYDELQPTSVASYSAAIFPVTRPVTIVNPLSGASIFVYSEIPNVSLIQPQSCSITVKFKVTTSL